MSVIILTLLVVLNLRVLSIYSHPYNHNNNSSSTAKTKTASFTAANPKVRKPIHNNTISVSSLSDPSPSSPCSKYDGLLHIRMGDIGGAAGTVFFQFVVGQLLYAEKYNLLPWIYFDNTSHVIYDPIVHSVGPGTTIYTTTGERQAVNIRRQGGSFRDVVPGPPSIVVSTQPQKLHFEGTGVWALYFQPISKDYDPHDAACQALPYVTLTLKQITPGIHGFASWAPRCWRYPYLPDYIKQPHIPMHRWLEPHLQLGAQVAQRYIRFQPHIVAAAQRVNPYCSLTTHPCLGMHIRHSDKANGRKVIPVTDFLPFAQAFRHEGGTQIYLATDSTSVLSEIYDTWPKDLTSIIRTIGDDVVRSSDKTAVFDMGHHHRTNQEILIEIAALSRCQYFVHGLSAVSDSVLWMTGIELQARSVNLEIEEHMTPGSFGTLVQMSQRGGSNVNLSHLPGPDGIPIISRNKNWWDVGAAQWAQQQQEIEPPSPLTASPCKPYSGILHIHSVSLDAMAAGAFFTDIVNQLLYADQHKLLPWIHLNPNETTRIYDATTHDRDNDNSNNNGIWTTYFAPVPESDAFLFNDTVCRTKPVISLNATQVQHLVLSSSQLSSFVMAWRYDFIKEKHWPNSPKEISHLFRNMRQQGSDIVRRYMRLAPYITERAKEVNPVGRSVCLAMHKQHTGQSGVHRNTVAPEDYLPYLQAFVEAGGDYIYLATNSQRFILHMNNTLPPEIVAKVRTQGDHNVVRMTKIWSPDWIDNHHRVNSELLVDIQAMSQCQFLVHSYSTTPEAVIYLNPSLMNRSINLEQVDKMNPTAFGAMVRQVIKEKDAQGTSTNPDAPDNTNITALLPNIHNHTSPSFHVESVQNATIIRQATTVSSTTTTTTTTTSMCQTNAVVYLAQKTHSSYQRDSYAHLLRSIKLLHDNYLSMEDHADNVDIFIFHTSDLDERDLVELAQEAHPTKSNLVRIVNLTNSPYWRRPVHLEHDNPKTWNAYPLFSEGYRRMIHFFAMDIWQFFADYAQQSGCHYRYILRLDEDSYIHSPITYNIFDFMQSNNYVYGFRMCSYEMKIIRIIWQLFRRQNPNFTPKRNIDYGMCGFYNNFFVADIQFFLSKEVQSFLHLVDRRGSIYRRRLGDLLIHSTAVYAFAEESRIHRFLDFTYEHGTVVDTSTSSLSKSCLLWGGIQAGYNDPYSFRTLAEYYQRMLVDRNCTANATILFEDDLSPTYQHTILPTYRGTLGLHTITAGLVELPGKGLLSG
jgi:hypothetical protein